MKREHFAKVVEEALDSLPNGRGHAMEETQNQLPLLTRLR